METKQQVYTMRSATARVRKIIRVRIEIPILEYSTIRNSIASLVLTNLDIVAHYGRVLAKSNSTLMLSDLGKDAIVKIFPERTKLVIEYPETISEELRDVIMQVRLFARELARYQDYMYLKVMFSEINGKYQVYFQPRVRRKELKDIFEKCKFQERARVWYREYNCDVLAIQDILHVTQLAKFIKILTLCKLDDKLYIVDKLEVIYRIFQEVKRVRSVRE